MAQTPADGNIPPGEWGFRDWSDGQREASLKALYEEVDQRVAAAQAWYHNRKWAKKWTSLVVRGLSIGFTTIGSLLPLVVSTGWLDCGRTAEALVAWHARVNGCGYISIGLAAACIAVDRFFGSSTGWMRYMAAANALETLRVTFHQGWDRLEVGRAGATPTREDAIARLALMESLESGARKVIADETAAWMVEFQANLAELEKQTRAALEQATKGAEAATLAANERAAADTPGSLQISVATGVAPGFEVYLDGTAVGKAATLGCTDVRSGFRIVELRAADQTVLASRVVEVKPKAITTVSLP